MQCAQTTCCTFVFLLTNIYTYRFIYYHKWRMLPPPQRSHSTTEGSSSGPKWHNTLFRPKYPFFFFSFLFFLLPYIGLHTSTNSRCFHHNNNNGRLRGVTRGTPKRHHAMSLGHVVCFFFFILIYFHINNFFFRYNAHIFEQPPPWTATTTKQQMANTA